MTSLQRASFSPGVWHALSHSSQEAPKILSGLFRKGTLADELIVKFSPLGSSSCYRAYALRRICGMAGPTTRPISRPYHGSVTFIIQSLDDLEIPGLSPELYPLQQRKRPKAYSDLLMKKFLREELSEYGYKAGEDTLDETTKEWVVEMAIVGCLAWLWKHERNVVDIVLDAFPSGMNLKLFEDESTGSA